MAELNCQMHVKTATDYDDIYLTSKSQLVEYDNTTSGLSATNVQDAVDELDTNLINGLLLKRDKDVKITTNDIDKSTDANKIHLLDLSEEVQNAMAGTAPVIGSVVDGSLTSTKYANYSINKIKFDNNLQNALFQLNAISFTKLSGYYNEHGVFVPHAKYDSAFIACTYGDVFAITSYILSVSGMPIATFYDSNSVKIYSTEIIMSDTSFSDYKISIPSNCSYFSTTSRNDKGVALGIKKLELNDSILNDNTLPLSGMGAIFMGDSITAGQNGVSWRNSFISSSGVTEVMCTAVGGAHLTDYAGTILDGVNFEGDGNTLCNQVQKIINNPPTANVDFIIISAGINDRITKEELDGEVTQFVGEDKLYIDVNTVDRTRIDGAMRWQLEKLYSIFPNAIIFFATPLQAATLPNSTWIRYELLKGNYIKKVACQMATPTIDAGSMSGVYARYETDGVAGKYTVDGLHPNVNTYTKIGKYFAKVVTNYLS